MRWREIFRAPNGAVADDFQIWAIDTRSAFRINAFYKKNLGESPLRPASIAVVASLFLIFSFAHDAAALPGNPIRPESGSSIASRCGRMRIWLAPGSVGWLPPQLGAGRAPLLVQAHALWSPADLPLVMIAP